MLLAICVFAVVPLLHAMNVLIAGGGTIGLSTAYYLSQDPIRYPSIKILDPYGEASYASAGHDINKIIRVEYANQIYSRLAEEAIKIWDEDPIFQPVFHKSGYGKYAARVGLSFSSTIPAYEVGLGRC